MQKLKYMVRKHFPSAFDHLKGVFYCTREILENSFAGAKFNSLIWKWYDVFGTVKGFDVQSENLPHRQQLLSHIARSQPARNLLEVGCGYGANLSVIAMAEPSLQMTGLDINSRALAKARQNCAKHKIRTVLFKTHDLENSIPFGDQSFDIVLADALLMFFSQKRLITVLTDMVRVSRNIIIIHDFDNKEIDASIYDEGRWIHNYEKHMRKIDPHVKIERHETAFSGGLWSIHGAFLIFYLKQSNSSLLE